MRRLLVVAIVIAIGCKAKEEGKPTPAAPAGDPVTDRLKKAVAAAFPGSTLRMTPDDVLVVGAGSGSGTVEITLDNVRRSCASSEAECASAIESVVDNTKKTSLVIAKSEAPEAPPDKTKIRLTPKPTEWLDAADAGDNKDPEHAEDNRVVRQKFVGDLWWLYVIDEAGGMRIINNRQLKQLGMTVEQLHSLSVTNLAAQYPKLELADIAPGVWTIEPGDYLDSARLALSDQWRAEAKKRGGKLIASVPARSRVFVSNDPKQRAGFETITKKAFVEEDHPVSQVMLVWTDKGWQAEH